MTSGLGMLSSRDCVLYLPFKEGSGSTAYDYSGEGNDGTISGATYKKIVDGGYALDFDGNNDYVNLGSSIGISGSDSRTFVIWFKTSINNSRIYMFAHGELDYDKSFYIGTNKDQTGSIWFGGYGNNWETNSNVYAINTWHFLVLSYGGGDTSDIDFGLKVYIDGERLIWGRTDSGFLNTTDINLNIGRRNDDDLYFNGQLAYPMIFSRALSLPEIQAIYRATYIL